MTEGTRSHDSHDLDLAGQGLDLGKVGFDLPMDVLDLDGRRHSRHEERPGKEVEILGFTHCGQSRNDQGFLRTNSFSWE